MKISVVIPCFNCANTIENTLKSIFAQTYGDYEIIAVDDGSVDNTAHVLDKYKDNITYIYQENGGVSRARNTGVQYAQGEWIAFCDSDDVWVPAKLEIAAEAIRKDSFGCDIIFSDYSIMDEVKIVEMRGMMSKDTMFPIFKEYGLNILKLFDNNGTIKRIFADGAIQEIGIHYGNIFEWLILGNVILPSTAFVRKNVYEEENGFNPEIRNAEDTEFFLRLGKKHNFLYIDYPLISYRRSSSSLLATSMLKTIRNGIRAVEMNCKEDGETYRKYKKKIDISLARKYAKMAYFFISELQRRDALSAAMVSLKYKKREILAWKVILGCMAPVVVLRIIRKMKSRRKDVSSVRAG